MNVIYDEAKFIELLLDVAERLRVDKAGGATKSARPVRRRSA